MWTSVHVACRREPDWLRLSGASGVLQAGEPTKHTLGCHSAVQPPLPSSFAHLFLFLFLHSSHQIKSFCTSLRTTYIVNMLSALTVAL